MNQTNVVAATPCAQSDQQMARILDRLHAPPEPAIEVVALERITVEKILADLEAGDPIALTADGRLVPYLRLMLGEPKRELWAMHGVGPGEVWPMLSKEDAETHAKATMERCEQLGRDKGWELGTITINVIPSPYEPAWHFEIAAEEARKESDRLRKLSIGYHAQRDELLLAVAALLDENDTTPAAVAAKQLMDKITKESA